jgi:hypothetical protein
VVTDTHTDGETMAKYAGPDNQTLLNRYLSFIANNPKVRDVLQKAVDVEENNPQKRQYGWEWHDVNAYPATMMKLVVGELVRVFSKSNRYTMYLLVDRETMKRALHASRPAV